VGRWHEIAVWDGTVVKSLEVASERWRSWLAAARWRAWLAAPSLADVGLALALSVALVVEAGYHPWRTFNPVAFLITLPLAWRRHYPLSVFCLVVISAMVAIGPSELSGFIAIIIAAYSVGAYCRRRLLALSVLLAAATTTVLIFGGALPPIPDAAGPFVLLIPVWLVGDALRTWKLRAAAFEDKATRLEREQEQAREAAVAEERARIARELHDVVAHSVSVMVVQAGAARHIATTAPEQAADALRAVEVTGREAMAELRRLLGVLSAEGDGPSLAPQPGLEQLTSLVRRVGEAGLPIALHVEGRPCPLPPGIDLAAYRIIQEALTNALKYSGLARTEVVLDYREAELKVEILDDGAVYTTDNGASGRGLIGMRERVALYGGTLEAGPRLEHGYAVRAWLPLRSLES
jgi:signal transduction histidine kinase